MTSGLAGALLPGPGGAPRKVAAATEVLRLPEEGGSPTLVLPLLRRIKGGRSHSPRLARLLLCSTLRVIAAEFGAKTEYEIIQNYIVLLDVFNKLLLNKRYRWSLPSLKLLLWSQDFSVAYGMP